MSEKLRSTLEIAETKYQAPGTEPSVPSAPERIIAIPAQRTSPENLSAPDTADSPTVTPELAPLADAETPTSSETLHTDVEILGNHYPVRQLINEIGNQRMRIVESATANWKNMLDTPGKMRLGLVRSIAEGRLNRQQRKANAVSHLSDRNWLKRRRMRKLRKAQERFDKADGKYQGRKNRMAARKENVGKNVEQRRAAYRKELRVRRESALGRRALRHEMRAQDAGRFEARAVLKDIPQEHLERVGKLAAVAYASEKQAVQASKNEATQAKREKQTENAITTNRKRAVEMAQEAERASGIVEELETKAIPKAEESIQSLKDEMEKLDENDPARTTIALQIQQTEERIAIHRREIAYWQQVAHSNRERVVTLDENHTTLLESLGLNQTATQAATTSVNAAQRTARAHADALAKAVEEATNSGPEESNN